MLVIKLQRIGKKHQPGYRVVVAEKRSKLKGPPNEDLGSYNAFTKTLSVNRERVSYWLHVGARPTVTVHNLLVKDGVIGARKLPVKIGKPKEVEVKKEVAVEAPAAE